jgi:hypothetical protein
MLRLESSCDVTVQCATGKCAANLNCNIKRQRRRGKKGTNHFVHIEYYRSQGCLEQSGLYIKEILGAPFEVGAQ